MLLRFALAVAALLASAGVAWAQAYVPSVKIGTAALIAPTAADTYYGSGTTSTNGLGATVRPPEIVELARALKNNPDLIYEYVRNNIEVVWVYGLQKGALGTSIDKAGTAYDQAMLMVELLRQAGYTASYKQGTITLTGAQFTAWSGISDATAACQMLAAGGIPAAVNGTTSATCAYGAGTAITSVQLAHVWVSVTISGSSYVFDPAYKPYTWKTGINLAAAAGLTAGQALTQATSGMSSGATSGVNYVRSLNMTALSSTLQTYATNLLAYINANNLGAAEMEDIVGGGTIDAYVSPPTGLRQTTLPYTSSALKTWTGGIPDQYRTTLRTLVSANAATLFDRTFYVDEIYGRRLSLGTDFNDGAITQVSDYASETITLTLNGAVLNSVVLSPGGAMTARGTRVDVALTANHPYAAAADGTATTNGAYMDATVNKGMYLITGISILHGWGDTTPALLAKWSDERNSDAILPDLVLKPNDCEGGTAPCFHKYKQPAGDFAREKAGAGWLAQTTRASRLHAAVAKAVLQTHHVLGLVYGDAKLQLFKRSDYDPERQWTVSDNYDRIDADGAISLTSKTASAADRRAGLHAIAASSAALEASIVAQTKDLPDTASSATRFEWGNAPPANEDPSGVGARKFYEFTAANSTSASTLVRMEGVTSTTDVYGRAGVEEQPAISDSELQGWRSALSTAVTIYTAAGYNVVTSEESFLGPGQRGGTITYLPPYPGQSGPGGYTHDPTKQRGGALVATKYAAGEPVEIAHIVLGGWNGAQQLTKGGGGGATPDAQQKYDPAEAADILKSRFVDKSSALGVTLSNGQMSYESPASISVGSGKFPYALSASLSWRGGMPAPTGLGPSVASQPRVGWTTNWHNDLGISGSGLEAMGATEARAAAGTIAAFLAAQDIYKASPSIGRDVAGTLTQAWWARGMVGNVVTVALGHSTRQFVKLADGTFQTLGAGARDTLVQTGARTVYEERCSPGLVPPYAMTRGWDSAGVSFAVTNASGDVQNFGYWKSYYWDGGNFCGNVKGFRLSNWTFPQGVTVSLTYQPASSSTSPDWGESGPTDRIAEITNSLGRKLRFNYTGKQLTSIDDGTTRAIAFTDASHTDPAGAVTNYVYQLTGVPYKMLQRVFTADNTAKPNVEYTYDVFGRVKEVRDATALQRESRGPYQFFIADGTRGERVDPAGGSYTVVYDTRGRPARYTDEIGRLTQAFYDGRGRIKRYIYPELDEELIDYDDRNNPVKLTKKVKPSSCTPTCLPDQVVEAAYHTVLNKPLWVKDQLGRQSDFTYFETGNGKSLIATALRPAVAGTRPQYSYTYDSRGLPLTTTDPTGVVVQNTYDATTGDLLSMIVDPGTSPHIAATTVYAYDSLGNVTQVTDPRGNALTTSYDANRRKLEVKSYLGTTASPMGAAQRTTYDLVGRVIKEEKATAIAGATITYGHVTQTSYTPTGQQAQVTDADGRVTRMQYDSVDRLLVTIDPENRRERKVYDLAGQMLQEIRADASPLQQVYAEHSYTANGKEAWVKDAKGNQTTFTYDGFDRLKRTTFPNATYEELSYDAKGNVTSKLTRAGQLIVNTYDSLDRLATHLVPQPSPTPAILTSYTYDLTGRTTGISDNTGHSLSYGFDTAKRIVSVTQSAPTFTGTRVLAYQLDAVGNKIRATWADGYYVQYAFDALNRMTTATENGTFVLATYVYDALSRRTSLVYGNGTSQTHSYTVFGDMLTLAHTLSGAANTYTNTFTKSHQIASEGASTVAWAYVPATFQTTNYAAANNLNQYVNITVGANPTVTLAYDGNGNLTSDGTLTFTYDAQNIMRTATKAGTAASYAYDPTGRRQAKTVNGVTTTFFHDADEEIAEYDGANVLLRRYVPGPLTDMPIAMVTPAGGSTNARKYFHANRQGSTIAMSADNGTLAEGPYTYDAYGNGAPLTGVPFKYTGRRLDPETGLYYYRARYYSASLGRFLQSDSVGYADQMNLYAYVNNDPLNRTDPTGKFSLEDGIRSFGQAVDATIAGAEADPLGTALDFVPVVGDIKGAIEFAEDPTLLGAAALIVGLAPGIGDVAAKALRAADKVGDAAKAGARAERAAAAATCCFVAGTLVMTEEGLRPIETIEVGDKVLARDEGTGETALKPVTQLIRRHDRIIWKLTLASTGDDGKAVTTIYETTDDHPWRSLVGTWLKTMELKPGMEILRARGPPAKVVSVENTGKSQPTFNLEVADYHSYFVGELQAWVHNGACDRRVTLRKNVKEEIAKNQPRNANGEMIDPNTQQVLKPGQIDTGHKPGNEWRTRKAEHEANGSTRAEVIETENDASLYQLEDRSNNRSHRYEGK